MFNYSSAKHTITTDLCIVPGDNAIIKDLTTRPSPDKLIA